MGRPWIRWLSRIPVIAIAVSAALALPWAISWLWRWLPQQWDVWIIVAITADAALVLLAGIWWLWWRLPRRQVAQLALKIRDPKARADTEDNFRKTVGQALGGAAVLIGAGAAYLQFSQQQQAQQQTTEISRKAAQDLLISNQVAKGFEQLAGDKVAMRLGGIYGLAWVMNNSPEYHQPVLEALCAFVRESTRDLKGEGPPATDNQAALTIIGRRADGPGELDLNRANIPGASLSNANLFYANLRDANLRDANLSRAELYGANLTNADLRGTNLTSANLDSATLTDAHDLTQSQLDTACGNPRALPSGLTLDKPCPVPPQ